MGAEILDEKGEVIYIASLYLLRSEISSQRRVLHHVIPIILRDIPDKATEVTFISTINYFKKKAEFVRKNRPFAGANVTLDFQYLNRIKFDTVSLAIDAVVRRDSVIERMG
ncbi:hypothetical protein ACFVKC_40535 [Streptomyces noursei]|uniref:hypothetical protein n=1 Tax=Streptomyces noursei TaxID=1971 RepID=UPI00363CA3E2